MRLSIVPTLIESRLNVKKKELSILLSFWIWRIEPRQILEFLRSKLLNQHLPNEFIAKLNHLAYQGIRKNQFRRKIANRALENSTNFSNNEGQIKEIIKKFDIDKIKEKNKEISEKIGNCFLTTKDVFECVEDSDCIWLWLDVRRSEATIADPTKLIIKHIVPYFVSADAFIDAAQFVLRQNPEAHGGFDKKIKMQRF